MPVAVDIGFYVYGISDHGLGGVTTVIDFRADTFDDDTAASVCYFHRQNP
jgi:hypothetical protein